jgi:ABC-type nitrate/sulfonate/bicarbonate transport system ATPase subunit
MSKGMCQKMAIAQALLPSPGLLVLDEAWTGLDSAARGELDTAVRERVAAGGTVLFVDHDPARLAGLEDERWDFGSPGEVTVLAGAAPAAAPRLARVTIRIETSDAADVVERVRAIDGVRVVSVDVSES